MTEKQSSYRQIVKATSLFGGVQIFNILISIVRSKFIAVLLGPGGMGIAGLLNSTLRLIEGFSSLGLGTSAIKNVAAANASGDNAHLISVVGVLRRLVWITGFLGGIIAFILAPWLSQLTFGNHDYTLAYRWISMTLLFNQISVGQGVVLRGMRQLKYMARATLLGSLLGLLISVPLYYLYNIKGIVPAIIASSIISLLMTWYFSGKVKLEKASVSLKTAINEGKDMIRMGIMLSLSGLMALGASYIIRVYLSSKGGVAQVGLYNAGFAIINTYVGLVFTAMATDYYPRLSGVAKDNNLARNLMNEQAEVSILILAPILTFFLVFINWIVILLYSSKFVEINGMIQWAAIGIYFKAASFSVGYILLAKGASRLFLWNELASNAYILGFNVLGYHIAGLEGLGISFMIGYFIHLFQVFFVAKIKYDFSFDKEFYKIFILQLAIGIFCFIVVKIFSKPILYSVGSVLILVSLYFSYREMKRRIDFKLSFQKIRDKIKGLRSS